MKRLILVLVVLALLMLAMPVAAAPPGNPFVGSWESIDPDDGSNWHASIGGGRNLPFFFRSDAGSVCALLGLGLVPITTRGFGEITDEDPMTFEVMVDAYCHSRDGSGRVFVGSIPLVFVYESGTDTLITDFAGTGEVCWWRSGRPEACD